jgi:ubiquinone biosynthesis protein
MNSITEFMLKTTGAVGRMRAITAVLFKYGFGELAISTGLRKPRKCPKQDQCVFDEQATIWTRIKMAMEDLGPTTIKIGQILSLRADLVPIELCEELKSLQEDVRPETAKDIRETVAKAFEKPIALVFSEFDDEPVAAASLAQVHRARLLDGSEVAVKVRRPGVVKTIMSDLFIMRYLADLAHSRIPSLRSAHLPDIVKEVKKSLERELNFINEARSMRLFNKIFEDDPAVVAPGVHEEWLRENVLVMDYMPGARLDEFEGTDEERRRLARAGLDAAVTQMLEWGFFHADPHLGNLRIGPGNRLVFYDFGMIGRLSSEMRSAIIDYIIAIVHNEPSRVARVALDMAVKTPPFFDFQRFVTDVMFVMEKLHAPLHGDVNLGRFLLDLTSLCRSYGVFLRSDYILMARSMVATEAAGRTLDPDFDVMGALKPIAFKAMVKRRSIIFSDRSPLDGVEDAVNMLSTLPRRVNNLIDLAEHGELTMKIDMVEIDNQLNVVKQVAYIIAAGLVIASMVVGSAMIYTSNVGPHWNDIPVLGLFGFVASVAFGLWVIFHLFRGK